MTRLSQKERTIALALDLLILLALCFAAFGSFFPPVGDKGFWFYTALLSVLIGSKIATPFYIKPVDAISYAIPAFVALMLVNKWSEWPPETQTFFLVVTVFSALVALIGLITIVLNNWGREGFQRVSNKMRLVLEVIARPQVVYAPIIVFSMFAYHFDNPREIIFITISLLLTVSMSMGDGLVIASKRIFVAKNNNKLFEVGTIAAYQQPNILLLRQSANKSIPLQTVVYVKDKHSKSKLVFTLDVVGQDDGVLIRTVEIADLSKGKYSDLDLTLPVDSAGIISDDYLSQILKEENIDMPANVIGIVAPDSTISTLYFEVIDHKDLTEGRLVHVNVQGLKVLYQILGGLTKREIVQQKNSYGYLRVQAQQIGIWNHELLKFSQFDWLPNLNQPVYLEAQIEYVIEPNSIGHFPASNYQIRLGNIDHLVTHNTAILGILGVGKSMLAIELLERMMACGIKVICLDLTDQYASELSDYYNAPHEEQCLGRLRAATDQDRDAWQESPADGGSLPHLKNAIYEDLNEFINGGNENLLKIYNPAEFVATRQDRAPASFQTNGQWRRGAALFSVTPVEITQIVSEVALDILSHEMSNLARVCLVYEEAHSLVPEWNSVVSEGDKLATSGTARAILQGRKFGLGCLLVTQRTANVTKTILNQCNTIFAMRTFDETGKDFLSNYIGRNYADSLSSIKERHAVFFGKASSCENPVLMKVNDRASFLASFRATTPPPTFQPIVPQPAASSLTPSGEEDDIPF